MAGIVLYAVLQLNRVLPVNCAREDFDAESPTLCVTDVSEKSSRGELGR